MGDTRRLFFSLWPDDGVRQALTDVREGMDAGRGRPVHPLDFHVTLVFLGAVDAARLACVEAAGASAHGDAFELYLDHTGYWPRPRVSWCAPGESPAALVRLVGGLQESLRQCGHTPERRAYRPHVTFARDVRRAAGAPLENPVNWRCDRFVLVESTGARQPPRYRVRREWPLDTDGATG